MTIGWMYVGLKSKLLSQLGYANRNVPFEQLMAIGLAGLGLSLELYLNALRNG